MIFKICILAFRAGSRRRLRPRLPMISRISIYISRDVAVFDATHAHFYSITTFIDYRSMMMGGLEFYIITVR